MRAPRSSPPPVVATIGPLWLAAVIIASTRGQVDKLRPPVPQLILVALTVILIVAIRGVRSLRKWIYSRDLRWIVGGHVTRLLIGLGFVHA